MRKADYDLIATALADVRARKFTSDALAIVDDVARAIGSELLNTNPRFDLSRFLRISCGLKAKVSP